MIAKILRMELEVMDKFYDFSSSLVIVPFGRGQTNQSGFR